MIGKHIPSPKGRSSFTALNNYLTGEKHPRREDKVLFFDAINCNGETIQEITEDMVNVADNRHSNCKDPIFHGLLSWKEGEQPTQEQAKEAVGIALKELNLSNCQTLFALHKDTANYHVHIAVNRIDPETFSAIRPGGGFSRMAMERAARKIERAQGWEVENNAWSEINEEGNLIYKSDISGDKLPQRIKDMENLTGEESATRKAKDILRNDIKSAETWQELHETMFKNGMEYQKKGSGAVIKVGDVFVKASKTSKLLSLTQLEKRLGNYEEPIKSLKKDKIKEAEISSPKPMKGINKNSNWQQYITTRKEYCQNKKITRAEMSNKHQQAKEKLKERQRKERLELYNNRNKEPRKRSCFNQQKTFLALKHHEEMQALKDMQKQERDSHSKKKPPFPSYELWLLGQNLNNEAEEWRYRRYKMESENEITGEKVREDNKFAGLRGFKAQAIDDKKICFMRYDKPNVTSFIDAGAKIKIYDNEDSSILAAMQLGQQKWGTIRVNGSDEYKRHCVELAVENGIRIINPELQDVIKEYSKNYHTRLKEARKVANELENFKKYHDAVGADRYKVTATEFPKDGPKRGFMVNGRDGAPDGFTPQEVEKKIPGRLMSLKEQGRNIYYTPISEKKHHILVDDLDNESLAKMIVDGYKPAAIIQSSPGNWQAIITIPKLGTGIDREIGNALVRALNKEYGDPAVSGEIHAHRAPGFDNKKPKHQRPDGTFPEVILSRTEKVE
jgi:hypothetical protein